MAAKKVVERVKSSKAGGTILLEDGLGLNFSSRRGSSVYVGLLEQLLDAPKGSVLRCENLKARYSVTKAARKVGFTVAFAEQAGALYVKITGVKKEAAAAARSTADVPLESAVLKELAKGPLLLKEVARITMLPMAACAEFMAGLVAHGKVMCEDNCYRLKGRAA